MLQLLQLPRSCRRDLQPDPAEGTQQVHRRVRIEAGRLEQLLHPLQHLAQRGGPFAVRRSRTEQIGEDLLVPCRVPRQSGVLQLGGDQRAGRLRGQQPVDPSRLRRCRDRFALPHEFGDRVGVDARLVALEFEERSAGRTIGHPRRIPRRRGAGGQGGARRQLRVAQDRMAQPQVVAAVDAHPLGQQSRVPVGRVIPHPPGRRALLGRDERREILDVLDAE